MNPEKCANDRPPARGPRGLSLLELVLVMVIVGTMAAIAVPRFSRSTERYRADVAARRIVADLALARSEAQADSSSRTVRFDVTDSSYALVGVAGLDHASEAYTVNLAEAPYRVSLVSASFDDASNVADLLHEVVFDGFGVPDSGGEITVGAGSAAQTVVLDAGTGDASIQ